MKHGRNKKGGKKSTSGSSLKATYGKGHRKPTKRGSMRQAEEKLTKGDIFQRKPITVRAKK